MKARKDKNHISIKFMVLTENTEFYPDFDNYNKCKKRFGN